MTWFRLYLFLVIFSAWCPVGHATEVANPSKPVAWREVADGIWCGGEPSAPEQFKWMASRGVRWVLSVDGARPNVQGAHEAGLRYVHLPIGYDGIPEQVHVALDRFLSEERFPVYIHCHHGKHRAPAVALLLARKRGSIQSGVEAKTFLEEAGTGKDYPGLWKVVDAPLLRSTAGNWPDLPETCEVGGFVEAMAMMGRVQDEFNLLVRNQSGRRTLEWDEPARSAMVIQAGLIREAFVESLRFLPVETGVELKESLQAALRESEALRSAALKEDWDQLVEGWNKLTASCKACHQTWRDSP